MLQPLAVQGGPAGRCAQHEPAHLHISSRPDQVTDSLEAKHGVIDEKRNQVFPNRCVGISSSNKRRHGPRFGDAFFEDLAILGFVVIQKRRAVDRFIELTFGGVDANLAEQGVHAEGARFIRYDWYDPGSDLLITQQAAEKTNETHGSRHLKLPGPFCEFLEQLGRWWCQGFGAGCAFWKKPAQ